VRTKDALESLSRKVIENKEKENTQPSEMKRRMNTIIKKDKVLREYVILTNA
jgi:hypothetical protein